MKDDSYKKAERLPFKLNIGRLEPDEKHSELIRVQLILKRLGYLAEPFESARLDKPTQIAMRMFQALRGLDLTGTTDEKTIKSLESPKCGTPEPEWRSAVLKRVALGELLLDDFATDLRSGCAYLLIKKLKYDFVSATSDIKAEEMEQAIANAFATWQAAIPVDFELAPGDKDAKFKIGWFENFHGDGEENSFDGTDGRIAHAFYPPKCGNPHAGLCHFDEAERWGIGEDADRRILDLETQALHEIGHLLGLTHSNETTSTMYVDYRFNEDRRRLSPDAQQAIQAIYGVRK